jgi:hypothetical protein
VDLCRCSGGFDTGYDPQAVQTRLSKVGQRIVIIPMSAIRIV